MSRLFATAVLGLMATSPAPADDPPAKPKPGTTEHLLAALRQPVTPPENLPEVILPDLLQHLEKQFEIRFVVDTLSFRNAGEQNILESKPAESIDAASRLKNLPLHRFLTFVLEHRRGTYLVRRGYIEILSQAAAEEETLTGDFRFDEPRPKWPLVSAIYKEKPLNEVLADLAEEFDLNVIVAPQVRDAKAAFVSARLLNVPAERAIELIALQADLRVIHKGPAFFVTSRDHANELFDEQMEREKRKLELEKLKPPPIPLVRVPNGCGSIPAYIPAYTLPKRPVPPYVARQLGGR